MNKTKMTALISLAATTIASVAMPLVIIHLGEPRGAMGWFLLLFLVFDPLLLAGIGIASGLQLRKLWWLPLVCAVLIPLLYSLALGGFAVGLMWYTPLYLLVGGIPMLITYAITRKRQ